MRTSTLAATFVSLTTASAAWLPTAYNTKANTTTSAENCSCSEAGSTTPSTVLPVPAPAATSPGYTPSPEASNTPSPVASNTPSTPTDTYTGQASGPKIATAGTIIAFSALMLMI